MSTQQLQQPENTRRLVHKTQLCQANRSTNSIEFYSNSASGHKVSNHSKRDSGQLQTSACFGWIDKLDSLKTNQTSKGGLFSTWPHYTLIVRQLMAALRAIPAESTAGKNRAFLLQPLVRLHRDAAQPSRLARQTSKNRAIGAVPVVA